jgi:hypothetical protein
MLLWQRLQFLTAGALRRPDASAFDSFGRVLSGTIRVGDKVTNNRFCSALLLTFIKPSAGSRAW